MCIGVVPVVLTAPPPARERSGSLQFASTLYFRSVLEFLLDAVPQGWQAEIRLGLQEALVNAARHGNKLDPNKKITAEYYVQGYKYSWIISDQGDGIGECFTESCAVPPQLSEQGRGLFILQQIFDRVVWRGHSLYLEKYITPQKHPFIL